VRAFTTVAVVPSRVLDALTHLALEVKYADRARRFYEGRLGLRRARAGALGHGYAVGDATLVLRPPGEHPRGGLHVHYAMRTTDDAFDDWLARATRDRDPADDAQRHDAGVETHAFGSSRSLYVHDPDDHCVEVASGGDPAALATAPEAARGHDLPLTGIFEVAFEVESLADAESFYRALGFEPIDRGDARRRVRLRGPVDLELWESQLGLADARGGVHVDVGFATPDPEAAAAAVADRTTARVDHPDGTSVVGGHVDPPGIAVRDPDGHWLTFHEPAPGPDPDGDD
jgi:catechol 2,3-dioxygenase-like lactoylglutathione lyase family enzyme